ncbi:MAG: hypothetical protein ISR65_13085 [Bacteriovoracaceae bacterium]|nr:hypothetical protein [Bacteriovoracaceae bacterium]
MQKLILMINTALLVLLTSCIQAPTDQGANNPSTESRQTSTETVQALPIIKYINPVNNTTWATSDDQQRFNIIIKDPDTVGYQTVWILDGAPTLFPDGRDYFYITPSDLTVGPHKLEVQLVNRESISDVYTARIWHITIIPPSINADFLPPSNEMIYAIDQQTPFNWARDADARLNESIPRLKINSETHRDKSIAFYLDGNDTPMYSADFNSNLSKLEYNFHDNDPNFNFRLTNPYEPQLHTISAKVFYGAEQIGDTVEWDIQVRPQNSRPALTINAPTEIEQLMHEQDNNTLSFTVNLNDIDGIRNTTVKFALESVILDGTNKIFGTNRDSPDCDIEVSDPPRATCTFTAFNTNNNLDPESSNPNTMAIAPLVNKKLTATAYERLDDGIFLASNPVYWNLNVTEVNNQHTLLNIFTSGGATVDPNSDTYLSQDGNDTVTSSSFLEGDIMNVHLAVADRELDDYQVILKQDPTGGSNYVDIVGWTTNTQIFRGNNPNAISDMNVDLIRRLNNTVNDIITVKYTIPETLVTSDNSNTSLRLTSKDIPHTSALSLDMSVVFPNITIRNYNAVPVWGGSGQPETTTTTPYRIVTGVPLLLDSLASTDSSTQATENIINYQWQISRACNGSWSNIDNSNQSTLTWTPPPGLDNQNVCFRACMGDNGDNIANCATPDRKDPNQIGQAGPWGSDPNFFVTIVDSDKLISNNTDITEVVGLFDVNDLSSPTLNTVFARSGAVTLTLVQTRLSGDDYSLVIDANSNTETFALTDNSGAATRPPTDLSVAVDGNNLYISYQLYDDQSLTNISRVLVTNSYAPNDLQFTSTSGAQKTGSIFINKNDNRWYVPIFRDDGNIIDLLWSTLEDPNGCAPNCDRNASSTNVLSNINATEISNAYDLNTNSVHVMYRKQTPTNWNVYTYDFDNTADNYEHNTIFNATDITDATISFNGVSSTVYTAGINGLRNSIALASFKNVTGSAITRDTGNADPVNDNNLNGDANTLVQTTNITKKVQVSSAPDANNVVISVISNSNNLYLLNLQNPETYIGGALVTQKEVGFNVNPSDKQVQRDIFHMTPIYQDFKAGTNVAGNSNLKNISVLYYQADDSLRAVFTNTEYESIEATREDRGVGFNPGYLGPGPTP